MRSARLRIRPCAAARRRKARSSASCPLLSARRRAEFVFRLFSAARDMPTPTPEQYIPHVQRAPDWPFANEFMWMAVLPVEPPEYYPFPNCPYGIDAPDRGISNDTFTYEIPHFCRSVGGGRYCPQCNDANSGIN